MGIFDRIRKKTAAALPTDEAVKPKAATKAAKAPKKTSTKSKKAADAEVTKTEETTEVVAPKTVVIAGTSSRILAGPRVSEKAARLASTGTYVFNVSRSANKVEVRKAVEALYKVNVTSVRMIRGIGKFVRRGRIAGQRQDWKKALVTLKSGQTINLYEGV